MKRVIAVLLAVALVVSGFGGVAYAETANQVQLDFHVGWNYVSPEDTFTNGNVTGASRWSATIMDSDQLVTGTNLTLTSSLALDWFSPKPEPIDPQTYQWSFGDVSWAKAGAGFGSPDPFPVDFTPGFDASRSIVDNKTTFLQSEGTQTQTVNIKVTPRDSTDIDIRVMVPPMVQADAVVDTVITSPTTDETQGIWLSPEGDDLQIRPKNLEIGKERSVTVTIDVTPLVPKVKFEPSVEVHHPEKLETGSQTSSSDFTYTVPELGTWTWNTTGTYDWQWQDGIVRTVMWRWFAVDLANKVHAGFGTHWHYNVPDDIFPNHEVECEKSWHTNLHNWDDASGEPVNGVTLTLQSDQEFDYMNPDPDPDPTDPPTWSFGTVDQGSDVHANVGSGSGAFTPGFDASRLIVDNKTVFLKSEGTQTQTVDITVTPQLEEAPSMFDIHLDAGDYPLVNALISSVSTSEGYDTQVSWDERHAYIVVTDPGFGNTFTATVEIQVTPNVPEVEFIPYVRIGRSPFTPLYTTTNNLIVLTTEIGTWTWDAVGSYEWKVHAKEMIGCSLTWQSLCREIVEAGTISGYVSDGTSPIEGAKIDVYDYDSLFSGSWVYYGGTRTDADGNYTIDGIPAGECGVRVVADSQASEWYQDTHIRDEAKPVPVTAGVETKDINFSLELGGSISGRVTYLADGTAIPIANLRVTVSDSETMQWVTGSSTDYEGNYTVDGLPAGSFLVRAYPRGTGLNYIDEWYDNKYRRDEADPVEVIASEETSPIDFILEALERRDTTEKAIADGVAWLAGQQNDDGSWGTDNPLAKTGLAVLKLESHATDLGFSSPFDPEYLYHTEVEKGLNYIFANAYTIGITPQWAGDLDWDGDSIGVYFRSPEYPEGQEYLVYETGIAMMAIAASNSPDRAVSVTNGSPVNSWTYREVLRDAVDYIAWAQTDSGFGRGGWNYKPMNNAGSRSDQSNSGWATLGLAHAQAPPPIGFSLPIPGSVKRELDIWIDYIQNDVDGDPEDGGADYDGPDGTHELWVNILKTGNLLQQMAFVGDTAETPRVNDAIAYLVRQWGENYDPGWRGSPNCYHTTYTTMKGLEAFEIATIDGIDWFGDFDDALRNEQAAAGWWLSSRWDTGDRILSTEWALLTLQKVKALPPPPPPPVADAGGPYDIVKVGVPVELNGSDSYQPFDPEHPEVKEIVDWYWTFGDGGNDSVASVSHTYDTPGLYKAELTVTNNVGGHDTDSAMIVVYDPAAGFATGGGWFIPTKAKGDILPELDDTSPAKFGFVVKYKPGATTPDGQLEFQYRQGNFNLHSSGMEWLVVTNNNWAKFQGTATIKGLEGLFPFRVDARDGDFGGGTEPDRFIIKVWAPEEDPDKDELDYKAEGDLEGGSIVIHAKVVTKLRLQSWLQSGDPLMTPLENFAQSVEEQSKGSVLVELYPGNALVPNPELAEAVKQGDIEMGLIHSGWLRTYSPVIDGGTLPFLYNNDDGLMTAIQAGIGDILSEALVPHNITAIDWTAIGLAHLFNREVALNGQVLDHPIIHPDHVFGLNMRAPDGMQAKAITKWGGTAFWPLPLNELYAALETGTVDGAALPLRAYDSFELYKVAPYLCVDYAFANLAGICINSDVWNSLGTKEKNIIIEAAGDCAYQLLETGKQLDTDALQQIKGYEDVEVYELYLYPKERAVWIEASQPVWDGWLDRLGELRSVGEQIIDIALEHNPLP